METLVIPIPVYGCNSSLLIDDGGVGETDLKQVCSHCDTETCFMDCDGSLAADDDEAIFNHKNNSFVDGLASLLLAMVSAGYQFDDAKIQIINKTLESAHEAYVAQMITKRYPVMDKDRVDVDYDKPVLKSIRFNVPAPYTMGFDITESGAIPLSLLEECSYCSDSNCDGDCCEAANSNLSDLKGRLGYNAAMDALMVFTVYWYEAGLPINDTFIDCLLTAERSSGEYFS